MCHYIIIFFFQEYCLNCSSVNSPKGGYCEDPYDCRKFYVCAIYGQDLVFAYSRTCAPGTVWNQAYVTCVHLYMAPAKCQKWSKRTSRSTVNITKATSPMVTSSTAATTTGVPPLATPPTTQPGKQNQS